MGGLSRNACNKMIDLAMPKHPLSPLPRCQWSSHFELTATRILDIFLKIFFFIFFLILSQIRATPMERGVLLQLLILPLGNCA